MRHSLVPPELLTVAPEDLGPSPSGAMGFGLFEGGPGGAGSSEGSLKDSARPPLPAWSAETPEHLIVAGHGGAFSHPTHVFAVARLPGTVSKPLATSPPGTLRGRSISRALGRGYALGDDSSAESSDIASTSASRGGSPPPRPRPHFTADGAGHPLGGGGGTHFSSGFSRGSTPRNQHGLGPPAGPAGFGGSLHFAAGAAARDRQAPRREAIGEYRCFSSYPSPNDSLSLFTGPWAFRARNLTFELVGGVFYYLLVVGSLPRCSIRRVVHARTYAQGGLMFAQEVFSAIVDMLLESRVSILATFFLLAIMLALAKAGGAGIARLRWEDPAKGKARGGLFFGPLRPFTVLVPSALLGLAHAAAHLIVATLLGCLLELGLETCVTYTGMGEKGYPSLYRYYRELEASSFPDPAGLRLTLQRVTLGIYPGFLKLLLGAFDLPELIAVSRKSICAKGLENVSRPIALGYYGAMLPYFWILATPAVALVLGFYLFVCVNRLFLHFDEAFSALQVQNFKGLVRMRISPEGDLHVYGLGLDRVPSSWREDPNWKRCREENPAVHEAPWLAQFPSRWIPQGVRKRASRAERILGTILGPHLGWTGPLLRRLRAPARASLAVKVIDHLVISKPKGAGAPTAAAGAASADGHGHRL